MSNLLKTAAESYHSLAVTLNGPESVAHGKAAGDALYRHGDVPTFVKESLQATLAAGVYVGTVVIADAAEAREPLTHFASALMEEVKSIPAVVKHNRPKGASNACYR